MISDFSIMISFVNNNYKEVIKRHDLDNEEVDEGLKILL